MLRQVAGACAVVLSLSFTGCGGSAADVQPQSANALSLASHPCICMREIVMGGTELVELAFPFGCDVPVNGGPEALPLCPESPPLPECDCIREVVVRGEVVEFAVPHGCYTRAGRSLPYCSTTRP